MTGVQLHGAFAPEAPAELRRRLGAEIKILRVAHFGPQAAAESRVYLADPNVAAVLIDSRSRSAAGGTGVAFDWSQAQQTLFAEAEARRRLIVAGGLHPENVAEAIARLHPAGIDAVSGVKVNDATVVKADIQASNGVIHVIDRVLLPE